MKTVSLSGSPRENVGKKDAKKQRREGKVPCVIYGGKEQVHFAIEELAFDQLIFTPEVYVVNLTIDGKEHKAILQDVQYHPVSDKALHADFLEVVENKPVIVSIPVRLIGSSKGVLRGGKLIHKMHKLRVRGLIHDIPELIEVDVTPVDIAGSIKVKSIEVDNLSFLDTPNAVIARVKSARNMEEEEEGDEEETTEAEAPAAE
jgi:large subunit ribosomal protein L25